MLEKYEKQYGKTGSNNRTKSSVLELGPEGFNLLPPPPTFLSVETSSTPTAPCPSSPISWPHPFLLLWGQGLPGLLVPKHRPTSTLRHQNTWSPPISPPVTDCQRSPPAWGSSRLPLLTATLPCCGKHIFPLFRRPELVTSQLWVRGSCVILSGPQFPLGAVAGLDCRTNFQSPVSPDLSLYLI